MKNGSKEFNTINMIQLLKSQATTYGFRSWYPLLNKSGSNYPLVSEKLWAAYEDAIIEAQYLDCVWFDGEKIMPAVFKISGDSILEGLCRLKNVKELLPPYFSKFYFIVEDNVYLKTLEELSKPIFRNSEIIVLSKSELAKTIMNLIPKVKH
ncbi:MAG: hypothetical protein ABI378_01390 [Chitinophagaceae bacterium]